MSDAYPIEAGRDVTITVFGNPDGMSYDSASDTTQLALPDGSIDISFGPPPPTDRDPGNFYSNLADNLTESELSTVASKLLDNIAVDDQSRVEWLENMREGIKLLALSIKMPRGAAASGATPTEGVSTVDHPLLLEACLRFQANARGELLPSDGPVKVRNDGEGNSTNDRLAMALEKDLNHFLTKTATEYIPDTDRMLLQLGFCGISFKKGWHDPIKRRPVIQSIDAKDLIVSNAATDLEGSGRVTHRIMMRPSVLRRMQLIGAYRDVALQYPGMPSTPNPVDQAIGEIQGIAPPTYIDPADQDRELYECYCEIEVPGYEHKLDGKLTGLPLPYKVTIDKESRRILEIRRNWEEDDTFCLARNRIIAYTFIPGLGFYGIGLLNILGNATKAVTAAWRLLIDSGMFSNFPGFLYLKSLAKQLTNQFRVPPGGGMPLDVAGGDIRAAVMPLPYQGPNAVFMQLIENVVSTAQRVGGTAEMQVGEGKQDAPVGTTLALIEQATKLISAVHKRMHHSQGQEFDMLKSLLMEDPEALWRHHKKSKVLRLMIAQAGEQPTLDAEDQAEERHKLLFLEALENCELVPRADPNTSSQTERYLKSMGLKQLAQSDPAIDMVAVDKRIMAVMGIEDADSLFVPPPPPGAPPPQPAPEQITAQATIIAAQARMQDSQTKAAMVQQKAQTDLQSQQTDQNLKTQELASRERIANLGVAREMVIHARDQQQQNADRQQDQQQFEATRADTTHQSGVDNRQQQRDRAHEMTMAAMDRSHQAGVAAMGHKAAAHQDFFNAMHDVSQGVAQRQHDARQGVADRAHENFQGILDRTHEMQENARDRMVDSAKMSNGVASQ